MSKPEETPAAPKPILAAIIPMNLQIAAQVFNTFSATVPAGADKEYVENEANWAHVAQNLRLHDEVRVMSEDGSYLAYGLVLDVGSAFAKVRVLKEHKLDSFEPREAGTDYRVEYAGVSKKFRVIRKKDSKELRSGFVNRTDAHTWIINHAKAMAA